MTTEKIVQNITGQLSAVLQKRKVIFTDLKLSFKLLGRDSGDRYFTLVSRLNVKLNNGDIEKLKAFIVIDTFEEIEGGDIIKFAVKEEAIAIEKAIRDRNDLLNI